MITLEGTTDHEDDTDHVMVFPEAKKNSNDVMSVTKFETHIFCAIFLQVRGT
eukprot:SAG22_NODE_13472_length_405_cov_1.120915_2_plen_52_part_00